MTPRSEPVKIPSRKKTRHGARPALIAARRAASGVEYGILVGLIAVMAIGAVSATGGKISDIFATASQRVSNTVTGVVAAGADVASAVRIILTGAALPATNNATAISVNFATPDFLAIEGAAASDLSWAAGDLPIPAGLTLDPALGVLSGAIPTGGSYEFDVVASFGGKQGRAAYTIEVNGVRLAVTAIATGRVHSCAILASDGSVACWGGGGSGQLGRGSLASSFVPVAVTGLGANVRMISAGFGHTCAIDAAGVAKCWGQNDVGQLGRATTTTGLTPFQVSNLGSDVKMISAGTYHTCAIDSLGAAKCWGNGANGRLGDNATFVRTAPVQVQGQNSGMISIDAGSAHTCAVDAAGAATCWGTHTYGRLGSGVRSADSLIPVPVTGLGAGVQAISTGGLHSCAIVEGGGAMCWGHGANGRLGNDAATISWVPVNVVGLGGAMIDLSVGDSHSCAIDSAGAATCWGVGGSGRLGAGDQFDKSIPTQVSGLASGASSISAGQDHSCAIVAGGAMQCWGRGADGQLGTVVNAASVTPVDVFSPDGF